ncbi:MAG: TIGR02757 family protein [Deltaproteobacteria bacterium]|nr:TIGR02757 family protein [Deltaproteobacteria bacterium]
MSTLGRYLDRLYCRYDKSFLTSDPVQFPHAYVDTQDREIVAFLAALFAFGNVTSILNTVRRILTPMGPHPATSLNGLTSGSAKAYRGFVHRWVSATDLYALIRGMHRVLNEWGSLKCCFLAEHDPKSDDLSLAMGRFIARLRAAIGEKSLGLRFLLNDPATGAACKRFNMFLRWMARPADGIDLGLWPEISPRQLTIPVDTHIARISQFLGLTQRRTTNWAMAREITDALRSFAPDDPCKYDFALTRIGIVEGCRGYRHPKICPACPLDHVCRAPLRVSIHNDITPPFPLLI